jgi:hypothetical protein
MTRSRLPAPHTAARFTAGRFCIRKPTSEPHKCPLARYFDLPG